MNSNDIFSAISYIDDEYINEALQKNTRFKPVLRWIGIAACFVFSVASISLFWSLQNNGGMVETSQDPSSSFSSPPTSATTSHSGNLTQQTPQSGIPNWYKPGSLTVRTLTYKKNMIKFLADTSVPKPRVLPLDTSNNMPHFMNSSSNSEISLPSTANFSQCYDANLLLIDPSSQVPGHEKCSGLFYNTETREIICLSSLLKNQIDHNFHINVLGFNRRLNRCSFTTGQKAYCYDFGSKKLIKLPQCVADTETKAGMIINVSDDGRYIMALDVTDDSKPAALKIVDIDSDNIQAQHIYDYENEYYEPYKRLSFSPQGYFLVYATPPADEYSYVGTASGVWRMRDLNTGTEWQGKGIIIRFISNEKAVVVKTNDGARVYNTTNGVDITDSINLKAWEKSEVVTKVSGNKKSGYKTKISLTSLLPGGKTEVVKQAVDAYYISGEYLYTYTTGDAHIECLSLDTGRSFKVSVDSNYVEQTSNLQKECLIYHYIYRSDDGTRILMRFSTGEKIKEDDVAEYKENYIDLGNEKLDELFDSMSCLADMEDFVKDGLNFPSDKLDGRAPHFEFFSGDGYSALIMFKGFYNSDYCFWFVEDYRDKTFSFYIKYSMTNYALGNYYKHSDRPYRKKLSSSADSAKTKAVFDFLPTSNDNVDLGKYYVNSKFDSIKLWGDILKSDRLLNAINNSYVYDYENKSQDGSVMGYDFYDTEKLKEIIDIVLKKPTKAWVSLEGERETKGCKKQYQISMLAGPYNTDYEISIFKLANGKGMAFIDSQYRTLDNKEYQRLLDIYKELCNDAKGQYGQYIVG
ncbi:MAG: hypothetical protein PHX02_03735 [Oscillospiraceae bacterium]|nr:hypothetical protein [Oscillospiraceae bacterium]